MVVDVDAGRYGADSCVASKASTDITKARIIRNSSHAVSIRPLSSIFPPHYDVCLGIVFT